MASASNTKEPALNIAGTSTTICAGEVHCPDPSKGLLAEVVACEDPLNQREVPSLLTWVASFATYIYI